MRWATVVGGILIILGVIGLIFGGIGWTEEQAGVEAGPLEVRVEERRTIPIPPVLGGILLVGGAALLYLGLREERREV